MYRFEKKYVLNQNLKYEFLNIIKSYPLNSKSLFPPRIVNNVYGYDDLYKGGLSIRTPMNSNSSAGFMRCLYPQKEPRFIFPGHPASPNQVVSLRNLK